MAEEKVKGITVKKEKDMAEWYSQVCLKSELADFAPVKGCYIIRPLGYALWEGIQKYFDEKIKKAGVSNVYFPLFIPESFFKKEAEHAKGFSPEVAWVANEDEEEERLALRPTSETIMGDSFAKWIRSWRDLPLRTNQWCNVVRWETKATKLFLRSREFLWQEGHCAYETEDECDRENLMFLEEYKKLSEDMLAVPVIYGKKTEKEKFAGAKYTMSIEAFMPDGKAIQAGTSHNLGQGFMKVFGVRFLGKDEKIHVPWSSSWGISTRLIGTVVMTHSDNKGLVLPPKIAPNKVVVVPIIYDESRQAVIAKCNDVVRELKDFNPIFDDREEYTPGWKFNEWELKGTPIRIEIGPKDLETNQVVMVRRDNGKKLYIEIKDIKEAVAEQLALMQKDLFKKAKKSMKDSIVEAYDWKDFLKAAKQKKLIKTHFCGTTDCEDHIKDKTDGVTSRCIPIGEEKAPKNSKCVHCGKPAEWNIYFSKSY
ncbi:proline--tRNA ligase [Candidatus Woesearchaeota archaeon]|nr:proline--tRNA ligase [Candidatus Woesearchaeota archaeon]